MCGETIRESTATIPAAGHLDENNDGVCDVCSAAMPGAEPSDNPEDNNSSGIQSFFSRIITFFRSIIDFFARLFGKQ